MPADASGEEVALCATMPTAYGGYAPGPPYTGGTWNKPKRLFQGYLLTAGSPY